jgi:colicin import membrane protein
VKSKVYFVSNIAGIVSTSLLMAVVVLSYPQTVAAQEDVVRDQSSPGPNTSAIVERYPSGSIQSVKTADQALADVQQQRSSVEAGFADEERACYKKFFVTSCVDAAKEVRRRALVELQQVEIEANAFKRRARVEERDKALADKAPQAAPIVRPVKAPKNNDVAKEKNKTSPAQRSPSDSDKPDGPKRTGQSTSGSDRVAQHNAKLEKLKAEEAAGAQKRAENVAAFEKKARDAEERQREVAAKKAEKERNRAVKTSPTAPVPSDE